MDRVSSIQEIIKKVALAIIDNNDNKSIYNNDTGFLSNADILSHNIFTEEISKKFPKDDIFSEEGDKAVFEKKNISDYSWIIDPICGTTNYLYRIPFYSHSLSLLHNNSVIAAGVYDPSRNEMFFSDGNSFFINNKKFVLNNDKDLSESLISFNTNQSNFDDPNHSLQALLNKIAPPVCRRIHVFESANLELAYVAAGRLDAYFNPQDKPWDIAAAQIFMRTAKGSLKVFHNEDQSIFKQKGILAAGSKKLLDQIQEKL